MYFFKIIEFTAINIFIESMWIIITPQMLVLLQEALQSKEYVVCTSTYVINDKTATHVQMCPSPAKCMQVTDTS